MKDIPDLGRIDLDFAHLFATWFNRGFLMFHETDRNTPASTQDVLSDAHAPIAANEADTTVSYSPPNGQTG